LDPLELLDTVEELFRLDPSATYLERGAGIVARLAGVESYVWHGGDAVPQRGQAAGVVIVPLRHGRSVLGAIALAPARGTTIGHDAVRRARSAARILVKGHLCAQRLGYVGSRNKRGDQVQSALARSPLTPREREVVALLVAGASTRKIAAKTGLTVATVHTYLKRIYPKIGVHSRVELVARMVGTHGMP